jgi:hypothetical protein
LRICNGDHGKHAPSPSTQPSTPDRKSREEFGLLEFRHQVMLSCLLNADFLKTPRPFERHKIVIDVDQDTEDSSE